MNATAVPTSQGVSSAGETGPYRDACVVTWEGDAGTLLEARVETIRLPLSKVTERLPSARLRIKSLANGETIYARDEADSFVSMYRRYINQEVGEALVLTWAGGSSERFEILDVSMKQARRLFYESYRVDASLINLGGESNDILLTTCDGGAGPCSTTRFSWRNGKYQKAGTAPFEKLVSAVEKQLGK